MKKALMGTTALVAAAVTTGVVSADEMAAEPISLTIGGNSHWGIAVVDNEAEMNNDDIAISNDVELKFHGSTVLDSGVEVGIRIEIEGESSDDTDDDVSDEQGDETYMYVEGSFGTIRIGNDDAAAAQMGTAAPYATYFYGINTPFWTGGISSGGSLTTFAGASIGDSASMMYFSPVINGFQFGVSYAPEAGKEAQSGTASMAKGGDAVSIAARYDGAFGDAGVTVAGGYMSKDVPAMGTGDDAMPDRDVTEWAAGLVVSMSGVSVGGSYMVADDDQTDDDTTNYDVGIMYGEGPWAVSANWGQTSDDDDQNMTMDGVQVLDTEFSRLMATYNLGPGITLAGVVGSDSPANGEDTSFAGIAMGISF